MMQEEATRGVDLTAGFQIRRVMSPSAPVTGPRRTLTSTATAAEGERNKENTPPTAVGPTWGRRRARRSPLPSWYPRTPLRDVTVIINAVERRRLRVQAARLAQTNRDSDDSSHSSQPLPIDSTPELTRTCNASFDSPVEHPLQMSCSSSSCSPADSVSVDTTPETKQQVPETKKQVLDEEMLCSSIDQIEKIVMRNLTKTAKKEPVIKREAQRRTLMSLR